MSAKRRFGQHFLEPQWGERLMRVIAPQPDQTFLEIGPGRGVLTKRLADSGARVVAVEIDRQLASYLHRTMPPNVTLLLADFLTLDIDVVADLPPRHVRVVGNLPYNVSTPILRRLLDWSGDGRRAIDAVLMFQREVAHRVLGTPGTAHWGPLAIATQLSADAELAFTLPPGAFRPMPRVYSAVITFRFRPPPLDVGNRRFFERMVRVLFQRRRKTVRNALEPFVAGRGGGSASELLKQAGIDERTRPGRLRLSELAELSAVLQSERR